MDDARIKAATLVIHDNTRFDWDGSDAVARSVLAAADRAMPDHVMVDIRDVRDLLHAYMREMAGGICIFEESMHPPEHSDDDEHAMLWRLYELVKPSVPEFCEDIT